MTTEKGEEPMSGHKTIATYCIPYIQYLGTETEACFIKILLVHMNTP